MENILILSSERCGTTYLLNLISCSLHKCKNLNEFFNLHKDSICKHLQYIIKYVRQNRPECVLLYKDFLDNLTELNTELSIEKRLINHHHLIMKLRDLKKDKYNYSLTKLFLSQYDLKSPKNLEISPDPIFDAASSMLATTFKSKLKLS